jgi:molybdenum cofactor synthesis domain-containing protein
MNRVEIIAIGNEILTGRVLDSNSSWLAERITGLGGEVARIVVIPDDAEDIVREIQASVASEASVVVTTGGIGPTLDDKTLGAVALALDIPVVLHAEALEWVIQKYEEMKDEGYVDSDDITPSREKMAHLPDGSTPLPNSVGAAPGVMLEHKKMTFVCLPGVSAEMKAVFGEHVVEKLQSIFGPRIFLERNITTNAVDESSLVPIVEAVMRDVTDVHLKSKPTHFGEDVCIGIRLTASGESESEINVKIETAISLLDIELQSAGFAIIDFQK